MMSRSSASIDIDSVVEGLSVEQFADEFGIPRDKLKQSGKEIRMPCRLPGCDNCDQTGDRVIAVLADHRAKIWKCHHYVDGQACANKGDFVSLVSLAMGGPIKPRGSEFTKVKDKLLAMANGTSEPRQQTSSPDAKADSPHELCRKATRRSIPYSR